MKVILKEDVQGLGNTGEIVKVAAGYGRNYLIPKGLAVLATERSERVLTHQKQLIANRLAKSRDEAEALAARIGALSCTITKRVGEQEKLFGSVTSQEIADWLAQAGTEVDRRKILLDEPIKEAGQHLVEIRLHPEVMGQLRLTVVPEEGF
jgi:large subunit ribosomal protein L9